MAKAQAGHGRLTLVLGGARSGKSRYAESLVATLPKPWVYVATAEARDAEMAERIATHRARRGAGWQTVEAPHDLAVAVGKSPGGAALLIDCLTLWLSNRMLAEADMELEIDALEKALAAYQGPIVLVANEVGSGIVPDNALGAPLPRPARIAQSTHRGPRRPRDPHGRRTAADREGLPMTKIDRRQRSRAPSRQDGEPQGAAGRGGCRQDHSEKGLLIVHTGTGKGKSTAAFGLALRMLGRGMRVGVVQFIKGAWHTAERDALGKFGDQVSWHSMGEGFTWETQDLARDIEAAERAWDKAQELMADPSFALVILDELNIALRYDYLALDKVLAVLARAPSRPACRGHRAERQAQADRGRRSRHRDDAR